MAPARTPRAIVDRLHTEIVKALNSPELGGRLKAEGAQIGGGSPGAFGTLIRTEIAKYVNLVKQTGIRVE